MRWRIVATLLATLLVTVLGVAVVGERLAARIVREEAQRRLLAARDRAALALRAYADESRANLAALAADPRTVMAFKRLRRATRELDTEPATAPGSMAREGTFVRRYLSRYYAGELRRNRLQLDSLIVPEPAAIWLQAAYFARRENESDTAQTRPATPARDSLYEAENEIWQPVFRDLAARGGWEDLLLADVADGRVLYSVGKTPVFQTSLVDGPYAGSSLGLLFRALRRGRTGAAQLTDFAPFVPAHDLPVAFAGAPIFDGRTRIGALLVQEPADWIDRLLSAGGAWSAAGLGATGDLFVVGSDLRMRSRSRFFARLRSMHPAVERLGTTVLAFRFESIPGLSEANGNLTSYVNHRHVPVYGAAKPLEIAELPWSVVAEIEEAEALAPLVPLRKSLGLFVLGVLSIGAIVILSVAAWNLRPISRILDTLRAVRKGDAGARVPVQTGGEIGALGSAVNELIEAQAEWLEQESAQRQRRESEMQELVSVVKAFARGDLSRRARVDGHLAGLANALNAMGESVGQLTDRLCVVPPRVAETAYAMQTVADQVLQDTERQSGELGSASRAAVDIRDWLHGCTIDAQGVIDAASRVEQVSRSLTQSGAVAAEFAGESDNGYRPTRESGAADPRHLATARYQRLRATIDASKTLQDAIRNAIDAARRIRTGAETLRGHAQTLHLIALDLHTRGSVVSNGDLDAGAGADPRPRSMRRARVQFE